MSNSASRFEAAKVGVSDLGAAGTNDPGIALPSSVTETTALSTNLARLADRAREYVEAASSANTRRAYASDWKHYVAWCRRQNLSCRPPDPQVVGLYITRLRVRKRGKGDETELGVDDRATSFRHQLVLRAAWHGA